MRLGDILVGAGHITEAQLQAALAEQQVRPGRRLGEILASHKLVSEHDLAEALAREFQLPFVDLAAFPPDPAALALVPASVILERHVLPLGMNEGALVVALGDPLEFDALDAVRLHAKRPVKQVIAEPSQIEARIASLLQAPTEIPPTPGDIESILREIADTDVRTKAPAPNGGLEVAPVDEQSAAVIRLVNQLLVEAFRRNASDIHVEPNGPTAAVVVRLRVDGDCFVYHALPAPLGPPVVARMKIMADLDIAERRKPQDGKIRFKIGGQPAELRVATLPTVGGNEDVVLRLLPPSKPKPLEQMGLLEHNLRDLRTLLAKPYGLILCVGPTGSGKTTTLHSALGSINRPDVKIWTAEDPVEITQAGLRQVQVNRKIGFDFASAMRSFLRADPDVIMVGEMRDKETATTAVEASLTGHLVLSTLHTNNAPETVVRLLDMGLDPFGFADSLLGVLAQRLVRRLCGECRRRRAPTAFETETMIRAFGGENGELPALLRSGGDGEITLWEASGCEGCAGTGYRGRMAIHELLVADDAIRSVIARRGSMEETRALAARAGMGTLLQDGVHKAMAGLTDLRQVLAVCSR